MTSYNNPNKDAALGYKNPPSWSRFKKGQSGNPNGRSRKQPSLDNTASAHEAITVAAIIPSGVDDILRREFERMIAVTDAGGKTKMNMLELVTKAQLKAAAKGNVAAQRDVIRQAQNLERRDAERAIVMQQYAECEAQKQNETYRFVERWKHAQQQKWAKAEAEAEAEAEANGMLLVDIWPHPDDILLFPNRHDWTVRGPTNDSEVTLFGYYRATRDYLFAYAALMDRMYAGGTVQWSKIYDIFWLAYDVKLPLHWQRLPQYVDDMLRLSHLSLSQLKKHVRAQGVRRDRLHILAHIPPHGKEEYRFANTLLKPVFNAYDYRSLAHFERAYSDQGAKTPVVRAKPSA